ncbi:MULTISPECIES: copper resistance CopC family protein [Agrococcus]|uniref:CopC domain-containing protein n=2 Tax=Agrococcus carbonis TaxID=684552 RepID=A0A1H1TFR8_9MICO|nr:MULTISPECIES: copper resistance CopC family protein [Agrococcus]SDS58891.1 hypothetical protein SAMN04489719_2659 [Agrococcus carbonis]
MLLIVAAAAAVILLPSHASVTGSTPANGDVVVEQPGTFSVVMNEEILAIEGASGANVMQLTDADGLFYGDGCIAVEGGTIALDAELGGAGDYALTYQLVSADGHAVDGVIEFAFEPASGAEGARGGEAAPVCGESAPASSAPASRETGDSSSSSSPEAIAAPDTGAEDQTAEGGNLPLLVAGGVAAVVLAAGIVFAIKRRSGAEAGGADPS